MNLSFQQSRLITIIICSIILLSGGAQSLLTLGSLGYPSGYEGVKASFVGLDWNTEGQTGQEALVGMSFFFDPDDPTHGACNLEGEMTNAFVPEGSRPAGWVPADWWDIATGYINNPVNTYTWNLANPDNPDETVAYEMEEWILRMYVSITAKGDSGSGFTNLEYQNKRYQDTKVWIELDISPTWYFEGTSQTYFAIGKVVCSDFTYGKLGEDEGTYTKTAKASVAPESKTSYRYLYYQNYGKAGQLKEFDPNSYKGRLLNPSLFTDKVYMKLDLNNFGTEYTQFPLPVKKGDAATWGFDVHVFVVGEWKVQDIEEIPEDYGRIAQEERSWLELLLIDPSFKLWSFLGLIALGFLLLAVFAPGVLLAIFGLVGMFSNKKG